MESVDYELDITDEEQELKSAAHKFAADVLHPTGIALDRLQPEAVVAPGSPLFDVLRQASELGYTRLGASLL